MSQAGIVDVEASHPQIPTLFICDVGSAIPIANTLEILGTTVAAHGVPIQTVGSGNTVTSEIQYASSNVSSDSTLAGVASFDVGHFTVDSVGFVSLRNGGLSWFNISSNQTLVVGDGYFCVSPGGTLSLALPATASVGDTIAVCLDGATGFTITQSAMQQILIGASASTAGVGGSISSTAQGDTVTLVCRTANLIWRVISSMGNPTIV